ncbi:MAG: response regulator [Chloroflexi bacterium]|nr:response regulator [Chloroflexota bacterium]
MLKVLVIDPDSDFASLLDTEIQKRGHATLVVNSASDGIDSTTEFKPDLVIVDIDDTDTPASVLIKNLKQLVHGQIVACGNVGSLDDVRAAVAAGASDYVQKSVGATAIIDRVIPVECGENSAEPQQLSEVATDDDDDGDDDDGAENIEAAAQSTNTTRLSSLRAPVKEGKRPFCVVVAHPDAQKRTVLAETIERINEALRVIEVESSQAAIEACAQNRTVMLVIDWEMPDIPTRSVMRTVKESDTGRAISMFVTYKSSSPEKQRLAEFHGAIAFANEPWDDGSLVAKLKHSLEVIRKRRQKAKIQALNAKSA